MVRATKELKVLRLLSPWFTWLLTILKVGAGTDADVFLGPIQNSMQYERVKGFFSDIKKEKWNVAVGGINPEGPGYFITPTIIDRPDEDSRIVREEPFGKFLTKPSHDINSEKSRTICCKSPS